MPDTVNFVFNSTSSYKEPWAGFLWQYNGAWPINKGIEITYKSSDSLYLRFNQSNMDPTKSARHSYTLPASPSVKKAVYVPYSSFIQADWRGTSVMVDFDHTKLVGLNLCSLEKNKRYTGTLYSVKVKYSKVKIIHNFQNLTPTRVSLFFKSLLIKNLSPSSTFEYIFHCQLNFRRDI